MPDAREDGFYLIKFYITVTDVVMGSDGVDCRVWPFAYLFSGMIAHNC